LPTLILKGAELTPQRQYLRNTGDMFGTFMAWLSDCEAGGGTAYLVPGFQGVQMPNKGAAAFWYDFFRKISIKTNFLVFFENCGR
jgi:hypothetical protein